MSPPIVVLSRVYLPDERKGLLKVMLLLWLLLFFHSLTSAQAKNLELAQPKEVRRVLIFNELGPWSPVISVINDEIFAALEKSPYQIEFYVEHLDTNLFSDVASQRAFRRWYFQKFRNRKPDLILAIGPSARAFMSESHQVFSPGTPIIFWENSEENAETPKLDAEFTGAWGVAYPAKTLEVALRLQPGTKHVVVDGGVSVVDLQLMALVKQRLRDYESKLDITYLTDLPMPVLLERLKHLPSNTIVLHVCLLQDAAGQGFIDTTQSVSMIAGAANAPVFVLEDLSVNGGAVGGYVYSNVLTGKTLGGMAVRVLSGEKPQDIPIVRIPSVYMFDWPALQKWGLKESDLPTGSILINRQPTFWEFYKKYLFGLVATILVEAFLILALLWHRARRREAERQLVQSFETINGKLIEAHEEERTWIARELHDDINQRIALLSIDLEKCAQQLPTSKSEVHRQIGHVSQGLHGLGNDIQALSHRLHSSKLDYLGLVPAANSFCKELSEQNKVDIHFSHSGIPLGLPKEISLCLFRVLQESLQNAVKHSGERHFRVELHGSREQIQLTVNDRGGGFDLQDAMNRRGLGLISMGERMRLVGGNFSVESEPGRGTTISARAPLTAEENRAKLAG